MEGDHVNLEKTTKNANFIASIHWMAILAMIAVGFGWLCFIAPLIVNACIPEDKKDQVYQNHYKLALNYSITTLLVSILGVFIPITIGITAFVFTFVDLVSLILLPVAGLILFASACLLIYYLVTGIIALIKSINNEDYSIALVIPFLR